LVRVPSPVSNEDGQGKTPLEDRELGRRIRARREEAGRSLKTVATKVGVSESFLSQIERGVASPSIATLRGLAGALGISIATLFEGPATTGRVVRQTERRRLRHPRGEWDEFMLTPQASRRLQVILSVIEPGAGSGREPYTHNSDEECVIVLKGRMNVRVANDSYDLVKGDSVTFESRLPHSYRNPGPGRSEVLWVMTPPSY
jgi:transcriptional regulator with XRE-family HTH domain